jgi:DNA-directed RNA polymerase I subunit RPA2
MPDGTKRIPKKPTFNTLERENLFRNPPKDGSTYNVLNEFVKPHIESFNALFDDSGLPVGDGDGRGLISLAIRDIGERVVFDGNSRDSDPRGNRIRSEYFKILRHAHKYA